MTEELKISYTISPPPALSPSPKFAPSTTLSYPLSTATQEEHLKSLEAALGKARLAMNEKLTEWKDAIGSLEGKPKQKKAKNVDDEEEEEEEEE